MKRLISIIAFTALSCFADEVILFDSRIAPFTDDPAGLQVIDTAIKSRGGNPDLYAFTNGGHRIPSVSPAIYDTVSREWGPWLGSVTNTQAETDKSASRARRELRKFIGKKPTPKNIAAAVLDARAGCATATTYAIHRVAATNELHLLRLIKDFSDEKTSNEP